MATELTSEYEEQFASIPSKWYESETNRDWVFVLSALAILLPYTLSLATSVVEKKLNDQLITTAFISSIFFTLSLIFDKYTTYKGFALSDFLETNGIQSPIVELNPDIMHVSSKQEYLRELIRIKDVIALLFSIIPIIGVPAAAQRSLAGLNNMRVVKRTQKAYEQRYKKL